MNIVVGILQAGIALYQRTLSPDSGLFRGLFPHGFCKYHPTCSEYTKQAVGRYGAVRGLLKGVWRIMRCNPYSSGGFDPA